MSMKILTVDDSRTMRDMLRLALSGAGYEVVQAVDGVDGLEVLERETPALVITDINMPKMDGFGFIEGARKIDRFRVVPILVLTTESDAEKKQRARSGGRDRLDRQAVRPRQTRRRHSSRGRLKRGRVSSWIRCKRSETRSSRNAKNSSANSKPACWPCRSGATDDETVNAVFRAVHSIKGGAGAFKLDRLVKFAHVFETTLDKIRTGRTRAAIAAVMKTMLRAADALAGSRDGFARGRRLRRQSLERTDRGA